MILELVQPTSSRPIKLSADGSIMSPARPAPGLKQACADKRQDHQDQGTDDVDPELRGNRVM